MASQHDPNHSEDEEEEEEDARELKLGKVFQGAEVLTNAEVNLLLKKYVEVKRQKDANFQLNPMLKLAMEYAERFSNTKNPDVAQQIREMLVAHKVNEFEMGAIANLCPEKSDEVRALVPSIFAEDHMAEEEVQQMLDDMATYRAHE